MIKRDRIVITGIGLTSPNGNDLCEFRKNILAGEVRFQNIDLRYIGKVIAGVCSYNPLKYQNKKEVRAGTRAGSVSVYCAREAVADAGISINDSNRSRIGIYIGITEHGNVETENEIANISNYNYDVKFWNHYHNPRTVANNPAGEVTVNMGITGPHYCIGGACAAGNLGIIQGAQQLMLGETDIAIAGGVSESIHTFGIFASFKSQNALAYHENPNKASRPFDLDRNGIVVSEGGALYILERLEDAKKRNARIYAEIAGWSTNSDGTSYVLPNPERQAECMANAISHAGIDAKDVNILNTHATATKAGDIQECEAIRKVFASSGKYPFINNTKGFIGHAMGAAGALELAGNIPSFQDGIIHPCHNIDQLDPECDMPGLLSKEKTVLEPQKIRFILNNSFGMLGINSSLIIKRFED
ncbi:MAG TPA: beta-ketoacyl-[acyl-carrier-protein] synthase family protein [Victivallales bacterium]|nr:beta-ketoacyl-[acyl-carrier-protein] synthase family protein [Victivallales bacterium]